MSHSESEDDGIDDAEFDRTTEGDDEIDEDILDALEGDLAAAAAEEGTDGEDDSLSDDSDGGSDDDEAGYDDVLSQKQVQVEDVSGSVPPATTLSSSRDSPSGEEHSPAAAAPPRSRSLSPAHMRRIKLLSDISWPRSYTVEAICAIPQPVPTHCLASSLCLTHLLTGSEDGYIRNYDIFSAVNGKVFLTAPQRHHCGVMEGLMKAGQIKFWWENPGASDAGVNYGSSEEPRLSSVYSLAMHSDALWSLAGSDQGQINLFTVRHDPGRLCHSMKGHRGRPVSGLAMQHDEKGFFSAGWDGEAVQWDLNTGWAVRNFTAHGSQLTAIAVRPLAAPHAGHHWSSPRLNNQMQISTQGPPGDSSALGAAGEEMDWLKAELEGDSELIGQAAMGRRMSAGAAAPPPQKHEEDDKSDGSYDPLFDDEPDADGEPDQGDGAMVPPNPAAPPFSNLSHARFSDTKQRSFSTSQAHSGTRSAVAPKNAPPILDPLTYATFSSDTLMTASIDGQVILWDTRVHSPGTGVGRLWMSDKTPPWCVSACWSADGAQIYTGRRNGTIDIYDVRQTGRVGSGTPKILKTLRNPVSSGVVSCVVAFPDGRHLACASNDNIRLWNVAEAGEPDALGKMKSGVQFKIIPGHHGGFISQMLVDPAARFLMIQQPPFALFGYYHVNAPSHSRDTNEAIRGCREPRSVFSGAYIVNGSLSRAIYDSTASSRQSRCLAEIPAHFMSRLNSDVGIAVAAVTYVLDVIRPIVVPDQLREILSAL
ncbi:uncharacterized protein FIBRA_06798 [Fibroporia radiculosa]|uniref:Transcription factor spt8 beta-propeller domain-containing protein n=1 Tax=Fibroporia radiculosa TaxID=599839 RepID=J4H497_9APHY|nr:uncharacterized protein FIBRA_06798 [Fibroporia radiculosa]CCM04614.1 predicted protein [Fibroporia radiculosa]